MSRREGPEVILRPDPLTAEQIAALPPQPDACPKCGRPVIVASSGELQENGQTVGIWVCTGGSCDTVGFLDTELHDIVAAAAARRLGRHTKSSAKDRKRVHRLFTRHYAREAREDQAQEQHLERHIPRWAATHSFKRVWDYTKGCYDAVPDTPDHQSVTCALSTGAMGHTALTKAHVVVVPPEQVRVLPAWTAQDATRYATQLQLPFDPIYLDCTKAPGTGWKDMTAINTSIEVEGVGVASVTLAGALIWRPEDGYLSVIPYGTGVKVTGEDQWYMPAASHKDRRTIAPPFAPLGMYCAKPVGLEVNVDIDLAYTGNTLNGHKMDLAYVSAHAIAPGAPGYIAAGLPDPERFKQSPDWEKALRGWADLVLHQVSAALSVMYLMDSDVQLVQSPLTRPDRRRAQREGHKIPLAIAVKHKYRAPGKVSLHPDSRDIEWTHQWEVAGHYKHLSSPDDRRVACPSCKGQGVWTHREGTECTLCHESGLDPERVTPCVRKVHETGELTCPHGCRRLWCPPHWKGPQDKPMIPKMRVVR